jgi:tetratricopeptide (TPR) repeat protein
MDNRLQEERRRAEVGRLLAEVTLLRMRGQPQAALQRCQEALKVDPQSSFALEARGDVLSELGNHQAALESYRQAIQLSPNRMDLQEKEALVVLRLADREELSRIQQESLEVAEEQRKKGKTVPSAVVWSLVVPGGGYVYLGDRFRGALMSLAFVALAVYVVSALVGAVLRNVGAGWGLLGGMLAGLRGASVGSRIGFVVACSLLVAVYVFSVLDTLRKARGTLLLPLFPEMPPPAAGKAGDESSPAPGSTEKGGQGGSPVG